MQTVHIFFGEMGVGKSFLGRQFAEHHGYPFLEGDDAVPPQMAQAINLITPPPERIIESFVRNELLEAIKTFAAEYPQASSIVVSQALYRERHRNILANNLMGMGFGVRFYWVRCGFIQHARQLLSRPKGLGWLWFSLVNKPFFERPRRACKEVFNPGAR